MDGSGQLDSRTFSGFDFARLIRNFEITASSASETGQLRASAIAIYLVPALALNGGLLRAATACWPAVRAIGGAALVGAALYSVAVMVVIFLLSVLPINEFADVVGAPAYGSGVAAAGTLLMGWLGVEDLRHRASH